MVAITGNTYPVKDALKAIGAKWNADQKAWMVPDDKAQAAKDIMAQAPVKPYTGPKKAWTPTVCKQCGAHASQYIRVYRNGICRECYQEMSEDCY